MTAETRLRLVPSPLAGWWVETTQWVQPERVRLSARSRDGRRVKLGEILQADIELVSEVWIDWTAVLASVNQQAEVGT